MVERVPAYDGPGDPEEELREALHWRGVIGQATGILMERYGMGVDAAFAVLVRHSQHLNRKLRLVAEELVRTGQLPEDPVDGAGRRAR